MQPSFNLIGIFYWTLLDYFVIKPLISCVETIIYIKNILQTLYILLRFWRAFILFNKV